MSERETNAGKQLESLDFIESAIKLLSESGLNYLILVGTHENASTIYSHLDQHSAFILDEWNENGTLQDEVRSHLEGLINPE